MQGECLRKGGTVIHKRGKTYWYQFQINGKRIREAAKTTNKQVALQLEAGRRLACANGRGAASEILASSRTSLPSFCRGQKPTSNREPTRGIGFLESGLEPILWTNGSGSLAGRELRRLLWSVPVNAQTPDSIETLPVSEHFSTGASGWTI